jgi:hypothetical protein
LEGRFVDELCKKEINIQFSKSERRDHPLKGDELCLYFLAFQQWENMGNGFDLLESTKEFFSLLIYNT